MAEYTELPPEMGPEDQHESGDETHSQQQLVNVRINGRTMQMTPDDAQAWYDREQQFNQRLSQQGQELGELRQRVNGIVSQQGQQAPSAPQGDPDLMFFQSPTATMTRLLDERERKIREEMAAERAEQTNQQRLAAELDRFKAGIYRAHPELRDHADAVEFQMNKQWAAIKGLTYYPNELENGTAESQRLIADATFRLLDREPTGTRASRTVLPAGGARAAAPGATQGRRQPVAAQEPAHKSMTSMILDRQRKRKEAERLPIIPTNSQKPGG